VSLYTGEEETASPWPAFADLLSATTLLFLILFAALAVPALQRVGEADALESTLTRIDTVLSSVAPERGVTVQRVGDYVLVRIPGEATFSVDRFNLADLRPGGKSILREFGRFLRQDTILRLIDQVQVVGHTSREGSDEHNWVLSASRAATISLFLIDSGGQYADGTTDVTRTVAIGTPTGEMRDRFTRVLKGHIALARAVFPAGTRGGQLDVLARQYLWAAGLDYAHGTGHGVGSYLSVHEGPQRIAAASGSSEEPLVPGMIVSNEPGYYKTGAYGIRIENLILVTSREIAGAEKKMLGFETLTLAPIDRNLIDVTLLDAQERAWVDAYHARVVDALSPLIVDEARGWLEDVCRPL